MSHVDGHRRALPVVMGLDTSLASTGLAVCQGDSNHHLNRIVTKPSGNVLATRRARQTFIVNEVRAFAEAFNPVLIVIEGAAFAATRGQAHERAGLWWRVVDNLIDEFTFAIVPPTNRAMYATGKGNAGKEVVVPFVRETYPDLDLPTKGKVDDMADAFVLAAMGSRHLGFPIERKFLTDKRLSAMAGCEWPEGAAA